MRVSFVLRPFEVALAESVGSARSPKRTREGLFLEARAEGLTQVGLGEASPLPGYSDESLDDARAELERIVSRGLVLEDALDLGVVRRAVEAEHLGAPSARHALETALLDLAAQARTRSLARFIGGPEHAAPRPTNALVPPHADEERALESARAALLAGYRAFKVKLGGAAGFEAERALLETLRREFGPDIELRGDANGAWGTEEALVRLEALVSLAGGPGLSFVEEPVAPDDLLRLEDAPLPLAADETLRRPGALEELARLGAVRVAVLKPMVLGGLLPALSLARRSRALGLEVVVTHLFSGPVAHAAAAELALALEPSPLASGLAPSAVLDAFPGARLPQLAGAHLIDRPRVGLGLAPGALSARGGP